MKHAQDDPTRRTALPDEGSAEGRPGDGRSGDGRSDARRSGLASSPSSDWRAWLAGGTPREVLARIVQGDPLEVRERVARKLREDALLFDADRVQLRTLARCARAAPSYRGRPELDKWLDALVDEALRDLLREDDERAAPGATAPEPEGALVELSRPLGLDARSLAVACRAFNRLPVDERRAFFRLVLEGRSLDELARTAAAAAPRTTADPAGGKGEDDGARGATAVARAARRALCVLLEHARPAQPPAAVPPPDPSAEQGAIP